MGDYRLAVATNPTAPDITAVRADRVKYGLYVNYEQELRKNFVIHKSKAEIVEHLNKNGTIEQRFGMYILSGFIIVWLFAFISYLINKKRQKKHLKNLQRSRLRKRLKKQ